MGVFHLIWAVLWQSPVNGLGERIERMMRGGIRSIRSKNPLTALPLSHNLSLWNGPIAGGGDQPLGYGLMQPSPLRATGFPDKNKASMTTKQVAADELRVRDVRRPAQAAGALPPLENGDRLTRADFERRYEAMPHIKRAELIEGEVHMPSPVHHESHGRPHFILITWSGTYCAAAPGVTGSDNATLRLDLDNEPQPDILLRLELAAGGHSRISDDDYVEGAPELVVEVASSSVSIDLHRKKAVYRRNSVQEYLVWQTDDERVDWFELREGEYVPLASQEGEPGVLRSRVFPGLWLDVKALLAGDLAGVLAKLQQGLATEEHAAFVKRLAAASG